MIRTLKKWYVRVRFGKITSKVMASVGSHVCEIAYYHGRTGDLIGYWAYGYFDPEYPYRGQDL